MSRGGTVRGGEMSGGGSVQGGNVLHPQGRPPTPKPPTTQKSEPPREIGGPLTCSPYKQSGGSSKSSPPEPAFSLQREYLTVVAQGGDLEVLARTSVVKLYQQGEKT